MGIGRNNLHNTGHAEVFFIIRADQFVHGIFIAEEFVRHGFADDHRLFRMRKVVQCGLRIAPYQRKRKDVEKVFANPIHVALVEPVVPIRHHPDIDGAPHPGKVLYLRELVLERRSHRGRRACGTAVYYAVNTIGMLMVPVVAQLVLDVQ